MLASAYGVPVAVAARWFPDRRGLAVGLTLLGFGFSALLTANIAGFLIGATGVMNTFRVFGIAFIILIVVLALPLKFPAAGWKPAGWTPPAPAAGQAVTCEFKREQMLKTTTFYALWACYFIGCLAGLMAIGIAKPVGVDVGVEAGLATMLVGVFAIFNGFGRPVFGTLTDKLTPRNTAMLILRTYRTGITAHLADPVRSGIYPCFRHSLGLPWRLACYCTDCMWQLSLVPVIILDATESCSLHMVQVALSDRSWPGSLKHQPDHTWVCSPMFLCLR